MAIHKLFLTILTVVLGVSLLLAQDGSVTGVVRDAASGEPIPHANVQILQTKFGVATNGKGYFVIAGVPRGSYTVQVSRIGYASKQERVTISSGAPVNLQIALQAQAVEFREVVVTATRQHALSFEVPVATEVITRAQIERSSARNAGEALENVLGIFVKNYGNLGALKTASIRGTSENQVLVLLDGQRLNLAQGIAQDLSDLPLNNIERIEVVRGGHSALYGTDAVGGVINLVTRSSQSSALSGEVNSTIGSFGTRMGQVSVGQKVGALDYFLTHNYTESDGDFEFVGPDGVSQTRRNNDLRWHDSFLKLGYVFDPSTRISGFLQYHDAERGAPGPLSFPSELATQEDRSWKFNLHLDKQITSRVNLKVQAFYFDFKQNFDDPNEFFPISSEHDNDSYGISLQTGWHSARFGAITVGYEFRKDKITSTDVASQKRTNHSLFLQDRYQFAVSPVLQLALVPAFRVDETSDSDTQFSPKMGALLSFLKDKQVVVRSSWGRSYRLASFNDLYWPAGQFTAGNPDLLPEKGIGFDVGLLVNLDFNGFWGFEVNYFESNLENLIVWGPREDGVWSPDNVQEARLRGIETRASFRGLGDLLRLVANYNYLDAEDVSSASPFKGKQLIYRPQHKVDVDLGLSVKRMTLSGVYRFVGRRFSNADNSNSLDGYGLIDVAAAWKQPLFGGEVRVRLDVKNIFDRQVQIIDGFPMPGREVRTTVGFGF